LIRSQSTPDSVVSVEFSTILWEARSSGTISPIRVLTTDDRNRTRDALCSKATSAPHENTTWTQVLHSFKKKLWLRQRHIEKWFPLFAMVNEITPVSLGYPLSVCNKNSLSNTGEVFFCTMCKPFFLGQMYSRLRAGACFMAVVADMWIGQRPTNIHICISDTRCRESPSAWRTEHKEHVHVSFILNNGKLSPRRATALVALEMIDPKNNPFNCTSKNDVW